MKYITYVYTCGLLEENKIAYIQYKLHVSVGRETLIIALYCFDCFVKNLICTLKARTVTKKNVILIVLQKKVQMTANWCEKNPCQIA